MDLEPFSFYLSAWEEDRHTIAQANIELDEKLNIVQDIVDARRQGNFVLVNKSRSGLRGRQPRSNWFRSPRRSFHSSSMTTPTAR